MLIILEQSSHFSCFSIIYDVKRGAYSDPYGVCATRLYCLITSITCLTLSTVWLIIGVHLSVYIWLCSPFVGPRPLFQFLDLFTQSVGLLGRGISPSQSRFLHTHDSTNRINARRRTCLKLDSNPRSQRLSWIRQFMVTVIGFNYSLLFCDSWRKMICFAVHRPKHVVCFLLWFSDFENVTLLHYNVFANLKIFCALSC
jgi:hypothetical protein